MSTSTELKPSSRLIIIGKKHTNTATMIFGNIPNPNHKINKGASIMMGMVCDTIKSGYNAFLTAGNLSIAIASRSDNMIATANPVKASL
jgi:hypothetical protein